MDDAFYRSAAVKQPTALPFQPVPSPPRRTATPKGEDPTPSRGVRHPPGSSTKSKANPTR